MILSSLFKNLKCDVFCYFSCPFPIKGEKKGTPQKVKTFTLQKKMQEEKGRVALRFVSGSGDVGKEKEIERWVYIVFIV